MTLLLHFYWVLLLGSPLSAGHLQQDENDSARGVASNYPGDQGIEKDPAVLFADGFESGELSRWDEDQSEGDETRVKVTDNEPNVFSGKYACQMTATRGKNNGGGLIKWFPEGQDEIFARFYVKFADDVGYVHHFVHINGETKRWGSFGQAGKQPKGDDFFTTGIEPWFDWGKNPPPGKWNFYTYWQEMKAAPDGNYWGNSFPAENGDIPRGEWICIEVRVKLNTPGKHDGEQTLWRDGQQIAHVTGLNWRSTEKLKANVFWLMNYVTERAFGQTEQHAGKHTDLANIQSHTVWFDQVVVATKYIGPLQPHRLRRQLARNSSTVAGNSAR